MSITETLSAIQTQLKAPKNQFNKFGNYKYRSCEDILEGLKPLLAEHKAALVLNDEIQVISNRIYVKATATLKQGKDEISTTAYAREAESKKGMDDAQVTGATSSYARKYALNGLFACDDTKDADATNQHGKEQPAVKGNKPAPAPNPETEEQQRNALAGQIWSLFQERGKDKPAMLQSMTDFFNRKIAGASDLSLVDAREFLEVSRNG